jgi:hypothetical protein
MKIWTRALLALIVVIVSGGSATAHVHAFADTASPERSTEMEAACSSDPTAVLGGTCTPAARPAMSRYDARVTASVDAQSLGTVMAIERDPMSGPGAMRPSVGSWWSTWWRTRLG